MKGEGQMELKSECGRGGEGGRERVRERERERGSPSEAAQ